MTFDQWLDWKLGWAPYPPTEAQINKYRRLLYELYMEAMDNGYSPFGFYEQAAEVTR